MGLVGFMVMQTATTGWRLSKKVGNKVFYEHPVKGFRTFFGTSEHESTKLESMLLYAHDLACMIDATYDTAKYGGNYNARSTESMQAVQEKGFERVSPKEFRPAPNQGINKEKLPDLKDVRKLLKDPLCYVAVFRRLGRGREEQAEIVVSIRGTRLTSLSDWWEDATLSMERLYKSDRVAKIHKLVLLLIEKYGSESVCLTGHSLGAAIGFLVARQLYLDGKEVEGHFFELPFMPLDKVCVKILAAWEWEIAFLKKTMDVLHLNRLKEKMWGAIATGSAMLLSFDIDAAKDEFDKLGNWHPYIYVQKHDNIANGYIEFFKYNSDHNGISRGTPILHTIGLIVDLNPKARHLCPSAYLIIGDRGLGALTSHGISKWMNAEPLRIQAIKYTKLCEVKVLS